MMYARYMKHEWFWGVAPSGRDLGRLARKARLAAGLRQDELAERCQVGRMTISRLESGQDVSMATVAQALSECGYSLAVVPKGSTLSVEVSDGVS
jgi:transcriptional regulator with XRE-family HTH domain